MTASEPSGEGWRLLVVESETKEEREQRRSSAGKSAGESYRATLEQLRPGCEVMLTAPSEADAPPLSVTTLAGFDAVFVSGSPLHVYSESPEVERQIAFMRDVFASGTPGFGSCAGLQVAVAAAGGRVRAMGERREAGVARRIAPTEQGLDHPLLAGRGATWDALTMHGDEVEELPSGAILLAGSAAARVQAAEIRVGEGVFWGVQYHPELAPGEIAAALRRGAETLVEQGLAETPDEVEAQAALFDRLHRDPDSRSARWRLGVGDDVAVEAERRTELMNFLEHLVAPTRQARRG